MLIRKIRNKNALLFAFLAASFIQAQWAYAHCGPCEETKKELEKKDKNILLLKDAENKNQAYLGSHPDASESILIKVKSNLIVIKLRTETAQNEKTLLLANLKERCRQCP